VHIHVHAFCPIRTVKRPQWRTPVKNYKASIIALAGVMVGATMGALVYSSYRIPHGVTLSLVCYTNDARLHWGMYHGSTATNSRIAIFAVTNHSSRQVPYWRGSLQVRTPAGWEEDKGTEVAREEMTGPVWWGHRELIRFPVPDGTGTWKCSISICDLTYSPHLRSLRPKWQVALIDLLRRVGINLERERMYTIWSPELTR